MSIRGKTLAIFGASVVIMSLLAFGVARVTFYDRFIHHERNMIRAEANKLVSLLARSLANLGSTAGDWGPWDDTYRFLQNRNPVYIENNLDSQTIENLGLNFILFLDRKGEIFYAKGVDLETLDVLPVPRELTESTILQEYARTASVKSALLQGLIKCPGGILLTVATPILTSKRQGPVEGALVLARLVDRRLITQWEATLDVKVGAGSETEAFKIPADEMTNQRLRGISYTVATKPLNENRLAAWIRLHDLSGAQSVVFRIDADRVLYRQARSAMRLYGFSIGLAALLIGIGFLILLDRQVLARLHRLTESVRGIGQSRSFRRRLPQERPDELGLLAAAGNELLEALDQATKDLRARERDLHTVLENNPAAIVLVDCEQRTITWANSNALTLIGVTAEHVFGRLCHNYICSAGVGECPLLDLNQKRDSSERTLLRADGSHIPIYKRAVQIVYQERSHVLEAFFDISHQKELERDLRRAQSMELLGVLAGGVAHDLNNSLMALVGYPDLMLSKIDADHPFRSSLEALRTSAKKAAEMVEDLLTLARRNTAPSQCLSFNQLLKEQERSPQLRWLQSLYPEIEFQWDIAARDIWVMGSRVHLTKVLMNLVHNAAEAINGEGRVVTGMRVVHLFEDHAGFEKIPADTYALLQVTDTGCGMAKEDLPRIFEPFFTRKSMQRSGTGLGMTVVWNCVKDMDGFIDVTTAVGHGSCFSIYIPLVDGATAAAACGIEETTAHPGHGERILVVEDMPDQSQVFELILRDLGYQVLTATDMEDALAKYSDWSPEVCIIDMLMSSGPDGLEIFKAIRARRPSQKAIITSGFSETDRVKEALRLGASGYLKKPFISKELGALLHSALRQDVLAIHPLT